MASAVNSLSPKQATSIFVIVGTLVCCSESFAQLDSGTYVTPTGATVLECSDDATRIPSGDCLGLVGSIAGRELPISASISLDFSTSEPSMSAIIDNAYWEGASSFGLAEPFKLTLQSDLSRTIENGYAFSGAYFVAPWQFDWEFTLEDDNTLLWNGASYWTGGHFWSIYYEDVQLIPVPEASGLSLALWGMVSCATVGTIRRPTHKM